MALIGEMKFLEIGGNTYSIPISETIYCTCSTAEGTAAKTATIVSGELSTLATGTLVFVKFTNTNSASNPTLQVGSTTAKSIKKYGTTAAGTSSSSSWNAGAVISFIYDGTYWQMTDWINTTYSGMTDAEVSAGTGTTNRLITPARLKTAVQTWAPVTSVNGSTGAITITVPTKTSDLTNDSGFLTSFTETDPVFSASAAAGITSSDITNWDSKTSNVGTITGVTAGSGLSGGGTSGTVTVNHSNSVTAQTTQGLYPIKIDAQGHISNYGSAVTSLPASDVSAWAKASTKPSYTASEVGAVATSAVGAASGVAPLNASGKIDETYLPSYVDDVIEGYYYNSKFYKEAAHTTEITGEAGKIYIDLSTEKTYRYGGSAYVEISSGTSVTISRNLTSGTKSATINVDGTDYDIYSKSGTVTSVQVQATSPVVSSQNTSQSSSLNTTISLADNYGDTKNPYASKTKNYVLAAPSNAAGVPSFRALVAGDIPDLSGTYLTSYTETDPVFSASAAANISSTDISNWNAKGSVSSVGLTNATNGGLTISGSPVTSSGSITVGHTNILTSAQSTQAVYPIKIDKNGHISAYGSAVSIPSKTSDLTNDSGFITDAGVTSFNGDTGAITYTAPVTSVNGNTGAVTVVEDDHKWGGVTLGGTGANTAGNSYVPVKDSIGSTSGTASWATVTSTPTNYCIAKYDSNACLISTTPTSSDSSTKVATTAFVAGAISGISIPTATSTTPAMDGTAAVGSETTFARGDHVHPTDTSRAATTTVTTQASIGSDGLITYKNSGNTSLYTVQLPLFDGGTGSSSLDFLPLGGGTITGNLTVNGTTTLGSTLGVSGKITGGNGLDITGATTTQGNLSVNGTITSTGLLTASNGISTTTLTTSGNTTIGGTLGVTGAATLSSTLGVTGNSTLSTLTTNGKITANSGIDIIGNSILDGNLSIDGATTSTGLITANGGISTTTLTTSGNSTIGGTLGVTGNTTLNGTLSVTGNTTLNGVLDITNRRAEVTTSGIGWYRAIIYNAYNSNAALGTSGEIVDINIVYTSVVNVQHSIKLFMSYNEIKFMNETSHGTTNIVDKIRYNVNGSIGYIDVHFNSSTALQLNVSFSVAGRNYAQANWIAGTLAGVDDEPTGETIVTQYSFNASGVYLPETQVKGNFTVNNGFTILNGNTNINGDLLQYGDLEVTGGSLSVANDATVNGTLSVDGMTTLNGTLSMPNRRAALISDVPVGWHRVLSFEPNTVSYRLGRAGIIIDFYITRFSAANETHHISLSLIEGGVKFYNEESNSAASTSNIIDKIRYTYDDSKGYVDIHLAYISNYNLAVDYQVSGASALSFKGLIKTQNLTAVDDTPTGETILTEYQLNNSGIYTNNNLTVSNGTFDILNRQCSSSLSSAGWYRVLTYAGTSVNGRRGANARTIRFHINRAYTNTSNEIHEITLSQIWDNISFIDEYSKSNTKLIDKIRTTYKDNNLYVDIHYTGTSANSVYIDFEVYSAPATKKVFTANSLEAVADAPTGETIDTTYTFNANSELTLDGYAIAKPTAQSATRDTNFGTASNFAMTVYPFKAFGFAWCKYNIQVPALTAATYYTMCTLPSGTGPTSDTYYVLPGQVSSNYLIRITASTRVVEIYSNNGTSSSQWVRGTFIYPI